MPGWPAWDKSNQFGWAAAWRPGKFRLLVDRGPEWACQDKQQAASQKKRGDPRLQIAPPLGIDKYSFNMVNGPYAARGLQGGVDASSAVDPLVGLLSSARVWPSARHPHLASP